MVRRTFLAVDEIEAAAMERARAMAVPQARVRRVEQDATSPSKPAKG